MKIKHIARFGLFLFTLIFFFSCAGYQTGKSPHPFPAENLPQIGTRQAALAREKPRSSILVQMIKKAENQIRLNKPESAFNTLVRALDIDGQDSLVWHLMARTRLLQGNLEQAKALARKSNTLAVHTPSLKKKNWALIADVLQQQGRLQEAKEAREKSSGYTGE